MSNYDIPSWAGKPPTGLHLDVTKDGKLIQKLMIDEKRCYLFGRNAQVPMTIITNTVLSGFFSPILRLRDQKNFRNLEFRREILEFRKKSFHFHGGNLEFPLSLEEKS